LWIPEEIDRLRKKSDQEERGTRSLEKTYVLKETSAETETQKWDKEPRPETAATKQMGIEQDPQEDPRAGNRKTSSRDVQRVTRNKKLDLLDGSTAFETEEEPTSTVSVR
jgi:hypothetical protein